MSDFLDDGRAALEWVERYLERVGELPVLAQVEPGEIRSRLPASPPEEAEPFSAVLRDLDEVLLPGVTHWQHPRYFAYFATNASRPGILAELLAAALNNVGDPVAHGAGLDRARGAGVRLGRAAARAAGGLARAHRGLGVDLDAGRADRRAPHDGPRPRRVLRARALVGREGRADARDASCARCRSTASTGCGSTGSTCPRPPWWCRRSARPRPTSVDPVAAVADLCERTGTWLHVDAAYAGTAMVCEEHRWAFAGVERADSLVVNAHKWMLTPMDCSLLWTSRPADFRAAFSLVPEYLRTPDAEDALSLSEYGPALGRRFRSLKLWAVLRCYGRDRAAARIREHVRLAELFEGWVRDEPGWELCAPRPFSVVCFRKQGSDEENEAILERVNASGEMFISHTRLDGRYVLRLAVGSERTTEDGRAPRLGRDQAALTHSSSGPRKEMFGWNGNRPGPATSRRPGKRVDQPLEREPRLELAEARARRSSGCPCRTRGGGGRSRAAGRSGRARGRRRRRGRSAASHRNSFAPSGRSTPPSVTGRVVTRRHTGTEVS